jgi:thiol:disulfide interchange protein DsbD
MGSMFALPTPLSPLPSTSSGPSSPPAWSRRWRSIGTGLLLAAAAAAMATAAHAAEPGAVVTTPQVRAELVAHAPEGLGPGKPMWLGLKIDHQPHWHTYWKNPGDSGLPTTLEWTLPAGAKAGDIAWPTPSKLPIGPLLNYGYEGTLLLPVPLTLPAGTGEGALPVKLRADWLVCKDVCIPEGGDFAITLPARSAIAGHAALFAAARAALPQPLAGASAWAAVEADALVLRVTGLPAAWQGQPVAFMPETAGVIQNAARVPGAWQDAVWTARVPLDPQRSASPRQMPAVLTTPGVAAGVQLTFDVSGTWPTAMVAPAAPALGEATVTPVGSSGAAPGLALALLLALAGGALLNLMPCVFPVLSLKVLGFASHAADRRQLLAGGLAYTAGVVVSFVALAALLLALRAGGEQLGWGFQLQSPAFVAALAALFTLIGLNLAGVFEVGSVLPSSWATARARHPLLDHALTGVLAVAVASPCTAPFMGASLGVAVTMPAAQALAVFAALGLGMALPYLAASAWPALARALPRPGPWMAHFKTLLAFPMFATVVWLVWVLGQQVGIDGAAALLVLLLALAFAAWALGSPALGRSARRGFGLTAVLLMAAALFWAAPALRQEAVASSAPGQPAVAGAERWLPWSPDAVREARAAGRPVFVDFTAAWCVTCQFNKRTTLARDDVSAAFGAKNVLLLRADWTRRDAAITAELTRLGRSGVPVYALYAPGSETPRLLSEILSAREVQDVLATLP